MSPLRKEYRLTVPKSKRKPTTMQFVHTARIIEDFCIRHWDSNTSSFVLKKCIEISADIYIQVTAANSIYPTKQSEATERALCLKRALSKLYSLKTQISLAYRHSLISTGLVKEINEHIEREKVLIKGILKKDKERYKGLSL